MKIGTICYATDQGIGMIPKWFYDNGVITDVVTFTHSSYINHQEWYPGSSNVTTRPFDRHQCVRDLVDRVEAMVFVETAFDWTIIPYCRSKGVRTYVICMYECTPAVVPHPPDKWLCPSLLDVQYFPGSPFVPIPVNLGTWKQRTRALKFLHNGGHLGMRGHKGTLEILRAIPLVKSPVDITIRSQDKPGLERLLRQVPQIRQDKRVTLEFGDRDYQTLFDDHDVFIMAEKYNGLSLPLQEARAAGMLVVTSNRFPMNTWLPEKYLIPVTSYSRQRVGGPYNEYDEALIDPTQIALTIDMIYGQDITSYSMSGLEWATNNSWEKLKSLWIKELSKV